MTTAITKRSRASSRSRPSVSSRSRHERAPKRSSRARSVGVRALPLVAELGDRALLAVRHEDRVVAEALAAARLVDDPAFEGADAAVLHAVGVERHELADVPRAPVIHAVELHEQP